MLEIALTEIIKKEITRARHPRARRQPTFYPSSASAELANGKIVGGCWFADYLRIAGVNPPDEAEFYMHMIWKLGKEVENIVIDAMKCAGIYESSGVKFFNPQYNISGELDIVGRYRFNGEVRYYGCESKSVYGIGATKTITGRSRAFKGEPAFDPQPKDENLMQTMIYLKEFSPESGTDYALDFFKLIYLPRDKPNDGRDYSISLVTKETLPTSMNGFASEMKDGEEYALVQTNGFDAYVETRFSVQSLYSRFLKAKEMKDKREVPVRPFSKFWTAEQIEALHDAGEVSNSAYESWVKKGKPLADLSVTPGHYLCQSYCEYRSICWKRNGSPNDKIFKADDLKEIDNGE